MGVMYVDPDVDAVYRVLDLTGVFINGVIDGTIARQKRFDLIGFGFLALISALGGGLLRDVFMQKGTPTAFAEPIYVGCALLGGLIAWLAHLQGRIWRIIFGGGDAIVLGVWSVTGSIKAPPLAQGPGRRPRDRVARAGAGVGPGEDSAGEAPADC